MKPIDELYRSMEDSRIDKLIETLGATGRSETPEEQPSKEE
jgi:hypothetical protein